MNSPSSEHSHGFRRRIRPVAAGVLVLLCLAAGANLASAQDPPQPDFFWPYGLVRLDGENVQPQQQQVIALVNGKACGESTTLVPVEGPGVPPGDVGKTAYVVNVLADGPNAGQRPGCGHPGDPVTLYFPQSHRLAVQQPAFAVGSLRVDVDLGPELSFRLVAPVVAGDGVE